MRRLESERLADTSRIETRCRYATPPFCRATRAIFPQGGTSYCCAPGALLAGELWGACVNQGACGWRYPANPARPAKAIVILHPEGGRWRRSEGKPTGRGGGE